MQILYKKYKCEILEIREQIGTSNSEGRLMSFWTDLYHIFKKKLSVPLHTPKTKVTYQ